MNVLVIGYGKIGRIKSFIWQSLGRKVSVYDVDVRKKSQAKADGFDLYDRAYSYEDLVVDISTPAALHFQSLEWVLENIRPLPRSILIEKPLVSDEAERKAMQSLLGEVPDLKSKIIVNESYYLSSALSFMAREIAEYGPILSIDAEMSKNRLHDVADGRFVDEHLGSLGIELPHMIAMVETLGLSIKHLKPQKVVVYQDKEVVHNEGFTAYLVANDIPITLTSYLGDFRIADDNALPNESIVRSLMVRADLRDYKVLFDPVEGLDRYKAKITIVDHRVHMSESVVLDDDHLTAHLRKIHANKANKTLDTLFTADNALEMSNLIFGLKKMTSYKGILAKVETGSPVATMLRPHIPEEARM